MPIEHINKTDTLNEGREKINDAIDGANEANDISKEADVKATEALANSESTQVQLDTIVIEGDSSVEAAQARVDTNNNVFGTLKERLDTKDSEFTSMLSETEGQLIDIKSKVPDDFGSLVVEEHPLVNNPVLTASDITDKEDVRFIADPFIVYENGIYYMFFEVYIEDDINNVGHIGLATSVDGLSWEYDQIVLEDGNHFAYPNVFKLNDGNWYMLPDRGGRVKGLSLYRANNFPYDWEIDTVLFTSGTHVDATPVYWNDLWYLFTYTSGETSLYYADSLKSTDWTLHPSSPVLTGLNNRPGGQAIISDDFFDLVIQDGTSGNYGEKTWTYRVTDLTSSTINMTKAPKPFIEASRNGRWNTRGMHTANIAFSNKNSHPVIVVDGLNNNNNWEIGIFTTGTKTIPPVFRADRATNISMQSNVWSTVAFDRVNIDNKLTYNPFPLNQYVIPETGYYTLSVQLCFDTSSSITTNTRILVNGVETRSSPAPVGFTGRQVVQLNDVFLIKKGETVEVQFFHNSSSALSILSTGRSSWFSIAKID